jgi:hypothetical protein
MLNNDEQENNFLSLFQIKYSNVSNLEKIFFEEKKLLTF